MYCNWGKMRILYSTSSALSVWLQLPHVSFPWARVRLCMFLGYSGVATAGTSHTPSATAHTLAGHLAVAIYIPQNYEGETSK
jgi:hypothetical protein